MGGSWWLVGPGLDLWVKQTALERVVCVLWVGLVVLMAGLTGLGRVHGGQVLCARCRWHFFISKKHSIQVTEAPKTGKLCTWLIIP